MNNAEVKFECPECREKSTAESWDKNTISLCKNREMRRDYLSIAKKKKAFNRRVYRCPICGEIVEFERIRTFTYLHIEDKIKDTPDSQAEPKLSFNM